MTTPVVLPELTYHPTEACGDRFGHPVELVVVHRWGVRYVSEPAEKVDYEGVVRFFSDPRNQASAHIVFPGSAYPGHATQMVPWAKYAWAEAAYNPVADDVESADACWTFGADNHLVDLDGLHVLAHIVAFRLKKRHLPPVWSTRLGFCRHGDLGAAGGGHTACPTTNMALWRYFVRLVQAEYHKGGFRHSWGV